MTAARARASNSHGPSHLGSICARGWLALALIVALVGSAAGAEPIESVPNPRVRDGTWVTDVAGALRLDTVAKLNAMIGELERATGAEMAVVVVKSLDGRSVEEYAEKLVQLWGIGKAGFDNGLLLLWSTSDRRVRLEVGYGLEGTQPDGKVGAILDTYLIPRFTAGEFDEGVLAGVDAIVRTIGNQPVALVSPKSETYDRDADRGGGFGLRAFLLGLMGATTAGGSWLGLRRWRRYRRRRCPQCRTWMRRLDEAEDDASLEEGARAEERVGSVDYDVWTCPACSYRFTLRYPKWLTAYDKCPQCLNRTKSSTETVVEPATTNGPGSAKVVEQCAFCTYRVEYTKVLPRLERSASSGGSAGHSGGGSSSFGGGRSGGGGASRGY